MSDVTGVLHLFCLCQTYAMFSLCLLDEPLELFLLSHVCYVWVQSVCCCGYTDFNSIYQGDWVKFDLEKSCDETSKLSGGGGDHATPSEQFYRDSDLCVIRVSLHWQRCVLYLRGVPPGIWTLPRGCREGNRGWLKWSRKGQPCNVEVCKPWGRLIACAISSETWRGQNV